MNSPEYQVFEISDTDSVEGVPIIDISRDNMNDSGQVLDLTVEDNNNGNNKGKELAGSNINNSIYLDDDAYAFFVEAGLEDPSDLATLGINVEEIKAQRELVERIENNTNKRDFELAAQLQQQLQEEGKQYQTANLDISSHQAKRPKLEPTYKGKKAIEVIDDEDCIDLTTEDSIYNIETISDDEPEVSFLNMPPLNVSPAFVPYNPMRPTKATANNGLSGFPDGLRDLIPLFSRHGSPLSQAGSHFPPLQARSRFPIYASSSSSASQANAGSCHMTNIARQQGNPYANPNHARPLSQQETERELRDLLENVVDDNPPPPKDRTGTPRGLSIELLEHQKIGLQWMVKMENSNNKGGILADDMGLGKTIQALAIIIQNPCTELTELDPAYLRCRPRQLPTEEIRVKATLIVCPVSLMDQWRREIQEKTEPRLKVLVYHGSQRSNNPYELSQYDVIISSYSVTANNFHETQKGPLSYIRFHRVILDEAHTIKNKQTLGARGCCRIEATYRWCLTATPIQNKVDELYSLIKFLRIRPFCDWDEFRDAIVKPMKDGSHRKAIRVAYVLMKAIALRRSKKAKIDGRPILDLPERNIHMTHVDFSPDERIHYDFVEQRAQARFNKYLQAGSVMKNYSSVLVLLLRLRQACLHPNLTFTEGDIEEADPEKQEELAKKMKPEVVQRLLSSSATLSEIECPICLDIAQDAQIAKDCGHILCKECLDSFLNTNDDSSTKRCPHCRGDISKQSMVSLDAFIKVNAPGLIKEAEQQQEQEEETKEKEALQRAHEFIASAKINKMIDILDETAASTDGKDKTIVFSQFTAFLDLIGRPLKDRGHKYLRYDGSMGIKERADTVSKFYEDPEYKVLLVSTKCGSLGLNLTCANRVILMDIWWNPALENQAIDRVHRIGQTKPVEVHRIFINHTVEDRILELQNKKQVIADGVLGEGSSPPTSRLGLQEMIYLFRGGDLPEPSQPRIA